MPEPPSRPDAYAVCRTLMQLLAESRPELIPAFARIMRRLRPRRHGPGFSSVLWDGERYTFSASQARVVAVLWKAHGRSTPEVRQELLLEAAGSESGRLASLFQDHPSWGILVVPGQARGTFRLPD